MRSLLATLFVLSMLALTAHAQESTPPAGGAPNTAVHPPAPPPEPPAPPPEAPTPSAAPEPTAPPPPPTFPNAGGPGAGAAPYSNADYEQTEPTPALAVAKPDEPLGAFGLGMSFGFAFGGEKLVGASFDDGTDATIYGGNGVVFGVGAEIAPLRSGPHSLSLTIDQGIKVADITAQNGTITFIRFPLTTLAHYGYAFDETWGFTAGGGLVYEFGTKLTGDGDASGVDVSFDNGLGGLFEGGVSYRESSLLVRAVLSYEKLEHGVTGTSASIDASNAAFTASAHYFF